MFICLFFSKKPNAIYKKQTVSIKHKMRLKKNNTKSQNTK